MGDALELAGGVLAKEIETALQQSKFLIVICSPNSAQSPWVNKWDKGTGPCLTIM